MPVLVLSGSDDVLVPPLTDEFGNVGQPLQLFSGAPAKKKYFIYGHGAGHLSWSNACGWIDWLAELGPVMPAVSQDEIGLLTFLLGFQGCSMAPTTGYDPMSNSTGIDLARLYSGALFDMTLKGEDSGVLKEKFATSNNLPVTFFQPGQTAP